MTTPQYPWGSTSDSDLPQGVVVPSQLGSALQDHSKGKYVALADNRFPAIAKGTAAGSPSSVNGPMGIITRVFSGIVSNVATADPATVKGPDDIVAKAGGFFGGLPLVSFIGDIAGAISGAVGGGLNTIKTFFDDLLGGALQGINPFSIFSRIGDIFLHQAAVSNTASSAATAATQAQTQAQGALSAAQLADRKVMSLAQGGVRAIYTANATWVKQPPGAGELIKIVVLEYGGGGKGSPPAVNVANIAKAGVRGGFAIYEIGASLLPDTVDIVVGAGSTSTSPTISKFGELESTANGTVQNSTVIPVDPGVLPGMGSPSVSGQSGYVTGGSTIPPSGGASTLLAAGGASPGGAGGNASVTDQFLAGGAGGGGGQVSNSAFGPATNGGAGGFPGGPGGGAGRNSNEAYWVGGAGGPGLVAIIEYRAAVA